MTSDLILIAKKFSVPSAYGRRDGVRDFFAQYPDGVYIATDAGAPAGWEGYAVWFGGTGERYAERFMELIRDGYIVERFLRARVGGLLVFTFRCRLKMRRFGTLGKPHGEPDALNFYMPNGGTIRLTRTGSPTTVELEYSLDNRQTWTVWEEVGNVRSLTLTAGQRMYLRNTSETSTGFNTSYSGSNYKFSATDYYYAYGNINSLLCKYPQNAILTSYCFAALFQDDSHLLSMPLMPSTILADYCYMMTFQRCSHLEITTTLPAELLVSFCYYFLFDGCVMLKNIKTYMKNITPAGCTLLWVRNVYPTGDFYCPSTLTIPTGSDGIPSGWTRHDI